MADEINTVGDLAVYNRVASQAAAALDERRYEYILARRDAIEDKVRFGVLALNAASIIALLAAVGGDGGAAKWLGFDQASALWSAVAFTAGATLAAISILVELNRQHESAGDAVERYSAAQIWANTHAVPVSEQAIIANREAMEKYHKAPLVAFGYSVVAIWLRSISGCLWLVGMIYPLAKVLLA